VLFAVYSQVLARIRFKSAKGRPRHFASPIHAYTFNPEKQDNLIGRMLAIIASEPAPERPERSASRAKTPRPKSYRQLTKLRHLTGNLSRRGQPKKSGGRNH
jgi:hypothetical protein